MDIEQLQAEHIDYFVKKASNLKGSALSSVIIEATSHPSLFAFSEILAVPSVIELEGTENSAFLDLLRMFAYGTWSEYKIVASRLPQLIPDQVLKLKQLTVLTLAETIKVLSYDSLMQELDVTNVRELEDFLINSCMYVGIVRGKLDQLRRCFEVQFAAGRDLRPGQLGGMIQTLSNCFTPSFAWQPSAYKYNFAPKVGLDIIYKLVKINEKMILDIAANRLSTSDNLLVSIQEKIKWGDAMSEMDRKHRKEVEEQAEDVKKTLSLKADAELRGHQEIFSEHGGVMDFEEDRSRPKRRRHPIG